MVAELLQPSSTLMLTGRCKNTASSEDRTHNLKIVRHHDKPLKNHGVSRSWSLTHKIGYLHKYLHKVSAKFNIAMSSK